MENLEKFEFFQKKKKNSFDYKNEKCNLTFYENIGIYDLLRIRTI
jgi:hypothetical protein